MTYVPELLRTYETNRQTRKTKQTQPQAYQWFFSSVLHKSPWCCFPLWNAGPLCPQRWDQECQRTALRKRWPFSHWLCHSWGLTPRRRCSASTTHERIQWSVNFVIMSQQILVSHTASFQPHGKWKSKELCFRTNFTDRNTTTSSITVFPKRIQSGLLNKQY